MRMVRAASSGDELDVPSAKLAKTVVISSSSSSAIPCSCAWTSATACGCMAGLITLTLLPAGLSGTLRVWCCCMAYLLRHAECRVRASILLSHTSAWLCPVCAWLRVSRRSCAQGSCACYCTAVPCFGSAHGASHLLPDKLSGSAACNMPAWSEAKNDWACEGARDLLGLSPGALPENGSRCAAERALTASHKPHLCVCFHPRGPWWPHGSLGCQLHTSPIKMSRRCQFTAIKTARPGSQLSCCAAKLAMQGAEKCITARQDQLQRHMHTATFYEP